MSKVCSLIPVTDVRPAKPASITTYEDAKPCPRCQGKGWKFGEWRPADGRCFRCWGSGLVSKAHAADSKVYAAAMQAWQSQQPDELRYTFHAALCYGMDSLAASMTLRHLDTDGSDMEEQVATGLVPMDEGLLAAQALLEAFARGEIYRTVRVSERNAKALMRAFGLEA